MLSYKNIKRKNKLPDKSTIILTIIAFSLYISLIVRAIQIIGG